MITSSSRMIIAMLPLGNRPSVVYIVLLLTLCVSKAISAENDDREEEFCLFEATVDLTRVTPNAAGFLAEAGHVFPPNATRLRNGVRYGCICDIKQCLLICPPWNYTDAGETRVVGNSVDYNAILQVYTTNLSIDNESGASTRERRYHLILQQPCPHTISYFLDPMGYEPDEFYLLRNGSLFLPRREEFIGVDGYCLQLLGNDSTYTPRLCGVDEEQKDDYESAKYIGGLVALPFLLATVIIYSVLPELRHFHSMALRCYLCCLILTYVAFGVQQLPEPDYDTGPFCLFLGFLAYFSFLASFTWLNVMCFDMWQTFGGFKPRIISGPHRGRGKIIRYSIYAWGIPVVLTAVCISMEFIPGVEESAFHPGFRLAVCWFDATIAEGLYLYGPAGVVIATNICLFALTAWKLAQHDKSTQRQLNNGESGRHNDTRQWFRLYLKLCIVMGITWSSEIISWLWKRPKYFWYVMDTFNALQGILIFVFFVCKRNVLRSLTKREKINGAGLQLPGRISVSRDLSGNYPASAISNEQKSSSSCSENRSQLTESETLD